MLRLRAGSQRLSGTGESRSTGPQQQNTDDHKGSLEAPRSHISGEQKASASAFRMIICNGLMSDFMGAFCMPSCTCHTRYVWRGPPRLPGGPGPLTHPRNSTTSSERQTCSKSESGNFAAVVHYPMSLTIQCIAGLLSQSIGTMQSAIDVCFTLQTAGWKAVIIARP